MRALVRRTAVLVTTATLLHAQQPAPQQPAVPDTAVLQRLVATIEDEAKRKELVETLQALVAATQDPAESEAGPTLIQSVTATLAELSDDVRSSALLVVEQASRVPERLRGVWRRLQDPADREFVLGEAGRAGLVLAAALAGFVAAAWVLRRLGRREAAVPGVRNGARWLALAMRIALRAVVLAVPAAVAVALGLFAATVLQVGPATRIALVAALTAIAIRRAATVLIETILAPTAPAARPVPLDDARATLLARQLHRVASIATWGWLAVAAVAALTQDAELAAALREVYGLVLLGTAIGFVLANRRAARTWIGERRSASAAGSFVSLLWTLASVWWVLAIAYFVALYLAWSRDAAGGSRRVLDASLVSLGIMLVTSLALVAARGFVRWLHGRATALTASVPELNVRLPAYARIAHVTLDALLVLLALCFLLEAWGVDSFDALRSPAGRAVIAAVLNILLVILLATAAIDAAAVFTQRFIDQRVRTGMATAKVRTLVPLARTAVKVVVLVTAGMMILTNIGIDVGPLLAGVGILGLAVGFGAQTLVKDVITGIFILMEDAMSVGDICSIAGTGGVVENIGLRSVRLRDLDGVVHTIPFSSVDKVSNLTKEYSCWVVNASVGYGEDVDHVIAVLRQAGAELRADPTFGPDILEPIEIIGLDRFADSAVVVRARFKTRPAAQWRVGREFNKRMKQAFDAAGIEIPFPYRTVILRNESPSSPAPARDE